MRWFVIPLLALLGLFSVGAASAAEKPWVACYVQFGDDASKNMSMVFSLVNTTTAKEIYTVTKGVKDEVRSNAGMNWNITNIGNYLVIGSIHEPDFKFVVWREFTKTREQKYPTSPVVFMRGSQEIAKGNCSENNN